MKDYNEMCESVLNRRDSYFAKKKHRRTLLLRYGTPLLCGLLVVGLSVFVAKQQPPLPSSQTGNTPSVTNSDVSSQQLPNSVASQPVSSVSSLPSSLVESSSVQSDPEHQETMGSVQQNSQTVTSKPDVIWVPELPSLDSNTASSSSTSTSGSSSSDSGNDDLDAPLATPDTYDPYFTGFSDFEHWLVTGELGSNIEVNQWDEKQYLKKWVYMWQNADYTLKTGYYYKPINTMELEEISMCANENGYSFKYRYQLNNTLGGSTLTIVSNSDEYSQEQLQSRLNTLNTSGNTTQYIPARCNGITYQVFIAPSGSNFIEIFWQQEGRYYYAYYTSPNQEYQQVLKGLRMEKTPFRPDLKG